MRAAPCSFLRSIRGLYMLAGSFQAVVFRRNMAADPAQGLNERGPCSAATSQNGNSHLRVDSHLIRKALRCHGIQAGSGIREPCVRLDDDRKVCVRADLFYDGNQVPGPERAVYADCLHAQRVERERHGCRISPGKGSPGLFEGHCDPDRKRSVLLCREDSSSYFVQVRHCLENDKIRPGSFPSADNLAKAFIGLVKGKGPKRLHQFADRTDIQCRFYVQAREGRCCLPGCGTVCGNHVFHRKTASFIFPAVGTEGVRIDDPASGFDIPLVDPQYNLRMLHAEDLRKCAGFHPGLLEHCAHGTVEQKKIPFFHIKSSFSEYRSYQQ